MGEDQTVAKADVEFGRVADEVRRFRIQVAARVDDYGAGAPTSR
jgi:hypothetical protein